MNLAALHTAATLTPTTHTTGAFSVAWLLVVIPLASAAVLLLGGRRTNAWGHLLGTLAPSASFVLGVILFAQLLGKQPGAIRALQFRALASLSRLLALAEADASAPPRDTATPQRRMRQGE